MTTRSETLVLSLLALVAAFRECVALRRDDEYRQAPIIARFLWKFQNTSLSRWLVTEGRADRRGPVSLRATSRTALRLLCRNLVLTYKKKTT